MGRANPSPNETLICINPSVTTTTTQEYTFLFPAIDGYSRLVTYLDCTVLVTIKLVLSLNCFFVPDRHGVLSRVHYDHKVENVDVRRWMIEHLGTDRSSIITGRSVHNGLNNCGVMSTILLFI